MHEFPEGTSDTVKNAWIVSKFGQVHSSSGIPSITLAKNWRVKWDAAPTPAAVTKGKGKGKGNAAAAAAADAADADDDDDDEDDEGGDGEMGRSTPASKQNFSALVAPQRKEKKANRGQSSKTQLLAKLNAKDTAMPQTPAEQYPFAKEIRKLQLKAAEAVAAANEIAKKANIKMTTSLIVVNNTNQVSKTGRPSSKNRANRERDTTFAAGKVDEEATSPPLTRKVVFVGRSPAVAAAAMAAYTAAAAGSSGAGAGAAIGSLEVLTTHATIAESNIKKDSKGKPLTTKASKSADDANANAEADL